MKVSREWPKRPSVRRGSSRIYFVQLWFIESDPAVEEALDKSSMVGGSTALLRRIWPRLLDAKAPSTTRHNYLRPRGFLEPDPDLAYEQDSRIRFVKRDVAPDAEARGLTLTLLPTSPRPGVGPVSAARADGKHQLSRHAGIDPAGL